MAAISVANTISAYTSPDYTKQLYIGSSSTNNQSPVNDLCSRLFATWTFTSAIVRGYAAYNIRNPAVYDLAMWTYGIALVHFVAELVAFRSARFKGRFVFPLLVASSSFIWMATQRGWYLD